MREKWIVERKKEEEKRKEEKMFFFSSRRRHTRCALVTEFRRVLFRSGPSRRSKRRPHRGDTRQPVGGTVGRAIAGASRLHGREALCPTMRGMPWRRSRRRCRSSAARQGAAPPKQIGRAHV